MTKETSGEPETALQPVTALQLFSEASQKAWDLSGSSTFTQLKNSQVAISLSRTPTDISRNIDDARLSAVRVREWVEYTHQSLADEANALLAKQEVETNEGVTTLDGQKKDLTKKKGDANVGTAAGAAGSLALALDSAGGMGFFSLLVTIATAVLTGASASESQEAGNQIKSVEASAEQLKQLLEEARKHKDSILLQIDKDQLKAIFEPTVVLHRVAHAKKIQEEFSKFAKRHGTGEDAVAQHLFDVAPEVAESLLNLLKGDYREADLNKLEAYGKDAPITASAEQRAALQFINHSLMVRRDYFEIWASKMHDLEEKKSKIEQAFAANQPEERPKLELFREKPISLSKSIKTDEENPPPEVQKPPVKITEGMQRGIDTVKKQDTLANTAVSGMQLALQSNMGIKEKHEALWKMPINQ
jgi:hypothetical protein